MAKKSRSTRLALLALGIIVGLGLAELTLLVISEIYLARRHDRAGPPLGGSGAIRILSLGESTTAGLMAGPGGSWPRQLERILNAAGAGRRFEVVNEGRPAIDTTYILDHLEENLDEHRPHIVVAMIGINDGPLDAPEFQVGGGPRIWKLARLVWMVLTAPPVPRDFTWAEAFAEHNAARVAIPDDADRTGAGRAERLLKEGDRDGARSAAEAARRASPHDARAAFVLARVLLAPRKRPASDTARAEKLLREAHEEAPCRTDAALSLFGIHAKTEPRVALEWARTALGCAPDSAGLRGSILLPWVGQTIEAALSHPGEPGPSEPAWVDPGDEDPFLAMLDGMLGLRLGAEERAITVFRRAFAHPRQSSMAIATYVLMVDRLASGGRRDLALRLLDVALEAPHPSDRALGICARLRSGEGDEEGAARCLDAARRVRESSHNEKTRQNYERLYDALRARGIVLVAMQYPTRSLAPLERTLGQREGLYYVSNEEDFREARTAAGRAALFVDLFAGDFGHMTDEGNRRVAENAAEVILTEVLPRHFAAKPPAGGEPAPPADRGRPPPFHPSG